MREISLKEMQQIELQLLIELDRVCKKYDLRYFMDGGTLLGAMCYEGFIPWDDDIDIKMPRKDYEKLASLSKEFPSHISLDFPSRKHCEYTMGKLIDTRTILIEGKKKTGVYIDILPMDGYPLDQTEWNSHLKALSRYNSLFHASLEGFASLKKSSSLVSRIKGYVYSFMYTPYSLYKKLVSIAKKYDYDESEFVGLLVEGNPEKERFEKSWLQLGFTLEFEGHFFPAPIEYKKHMEIFYGDHVTKEECYHNLPQYPSNHVHEVYWKD
ncbi:MAG: LicD family protein [Bacillota bacterium]|nr:LicD family protein [Bacillota bacterium]